MSAFIYLFHKRIIHWSEQTLFSKAVNLSGVRWYSILGNTPIPLNDMIIRENVSYSFDKGFYTLDEQPEAGWEKRGNIVKKLQILEAFNTIANNQKSRYTNNSVGQALADVLLVDEIRQYQKDGDFNKCIIIQSLHETIESNLSPDAPVTKLWLEYESFRNVVTYLNRLEHKIRNHLKEDDFESATDIITKELEKMRM